MTVSQELKQIHDLQTFITMDADSLKEEEKQKAIPLLMFFTEKRCVTVKARTCGNDSKQRGCVKKKMWHHKL